MNNHNQIPTSLSRRSFLGTTAGAIALSSPFLSGSAFANNPSVSMEVFLRISSLLSGIDLDRSYIQLGERVWNALIKEASNREVKQYQAVIKRLEKLPLDASNERIIGSLSPLGLKGINKAKEIARVWYTGRIMREDGYEVIDYDDALVWQACTFTKPPTTCGGHFGYWHYPYEGTKT